MTFLNEEQKASVREKLKLLQQSYADAVPAKIEEINTLWESFKNSRGDRHLDDAIMRTHNLAGTAKTYGFADLGDLAKKTEQSLISVKETNAEETSMKVAEQRVQDLNTAFSA